jgi:AraC-like DNA-binding protein
MLERESSQPARTNLKREIERLIAEAGFAPTPTLSQAARKLAVTPRTLQRRLTAEGLNFRRVLDGVRFSHAVALLKEPGSSVEAVAVQVGFSESSAFSRAFKRWTRSAPRQFVRAHDTCGTDDAGGAVAPFHP